jgi:lipopolysaccharide biosynthesis glycosyltransferase
MEDYLSECLDSVIKQTLKEIEIICVDDGSTDNALNILKKYAEKDKRITVIKQENLHSGVARNAGLSIARGKYLSFLDSDDFFELSMLEKMYEKIEKNQSDVIVCKCKTLDLVTGQFNEGKFNNSLRLDLIPQKNPFSVFDISKNIFQIFEGWAWDKLFRTEFILSNNLRFLNIINFNDNQFTFTALCLAKSITTVKERFVIKRHGHKKSLSANRWKDPTCFLLSFDKIKSNLEKKGLFNLVKESFWKWALKLCLLQLKYLDNNLKEYLYKILHEKLNSWDYIEKSSPFSNRYKALHYLKFQKNFPRINIAYIFNKNHINLILLSLFSLLKNSEYEIITIILLYNKISQFDLQRINELKEIRSFTLLSLYVSDELFIDFPLTDWTGKELWYKYILADKFSDLDKILYLDCHTIIRKSLLPLWEINMNNKLIAAVEDISFSRDKAKKANLKDNFYFNTGVLLINIKEWKKEGLFKKAVNYIKKNSKIFDPETTVLNIITDMKKIPLNPEYNYMEECWIDNNCQYSIEYLKLYKKKISTIFHYKGSQFKKQNCNSLFMNDYLKYESLLNNLKNTFLTIPIVLSSDDEYTLYMYTTMISILENKNKNTYYAFYLLVPSNFLKSNINKILSIADKYKCFITFINMDEKIFKYINMNIPHITVPTYYRLLIGDLLPNEIDKCIYLDSDICVCKDLSELFNIDIKENYIAGVVSPIYFFSEKKHCKRLNLPSMKQYVNAGMLIMNLKQIRKDNMTRKFIDLSKKNYDSQDQDVLNVACYGKILTLPPKYNAQVLRLKENNPLLRELYREEDIIEAKNSPFIIHYSNKKKPWNSLGIYMEKYWWNIAKQTPYINILYKKDNIYKNRIKKLWSLKYKKSLNLDNPRTFDEKIQWLKIYDSTPIKTLLSDKYLVRDWITEKIGEEYLIPLYAIYNKFKEIDFQKLPNQFVIKCNHGRGYRIIVKEKSQLNITEAKINVDKWMNENYAFRSILELQFRDIRHKILIEKYMNDSSGKLINHEIFCFEGKPKLLLVENEKCIKCKINCYNNDFYSFPSLEDHKYLEKMIELASIISVGFIFVRVDFYLINDKIYFNKMEFTTSSKEGDKIPNNIYRDLASLIKLPKLAYNIDTGEFYQLTKSFTIVPYYMILICLTCKILYNLWQVSEILLIS